MNQRGLSHANVGELWKLLSASTNSRERLRANLEDAYLEILEPTKQDGNCFFHAVSSQLRRLGLPDIGASQLRKGVVDTVRNTNFIQDLENFVQMSREHYIRKMSRNGEWADHVAVMAMAKFLQRDIMVVTSSPDSGPDNSICWVKGQDGGSDDPILLGHVWENHYESLRPKVSLTGASWNPDLVVPEVNDESLSAMLPDITESLQEFAYPSSKVFTEDITMKDASSTSVVASSTQEDFQRSIDDVNSDDEGKLTYVRPTMCRKQHNIKQKQVPRELLSKVTLDKLTKMKSELLTAIKISQEFWMDLQKHKVITQKQIKKIQKEGVAPDNVQVYDLIDYLMTGTDEMYHGFLKALTETRQGHVVREILQEQTPKPPRARSCCLSEERIDLLRRKKKQLSTTIKLSPSFWEVLKQYWVVTQSQIDDIQEMGFAIKEAQICNLVNHLMLGTQAQYQAFVDALKDTGQGHVIDELLHEVATEDKGLKRLDDEKVKLLQQKEPELLELISISPLFWAQLKRYDVVTAGDVDRIKKGGTASVQEQISSLVKHVLTLTNNKYYSFLRALNETGQHHVVTLVLKDVIPEETNFGEKLLCSTKICLLVAKMPAMKKRLVIQNKLWDALIKHGVLSISDVETFKNAGKSSNAKQVRDLVEYLMLRPNKTYHGFLKALSCSGQVYREIINDVLEEDLPDITNTPEDFELMKQTSNQDVFETKLKALKKYVKPTQAFWDALMRNNVLSFLEVEEFREEGETSEAQVSALIQYLKHGTKDTFQGFLYSLSETHQLHVVTEILEEDVPDLTAEAMQQEADASDVLLTKPKECLTIVKAPDLISQIKPTAKFWDCLVKHGVLTCTECADIKGTRSNTTQISELLEHLQKGTMRRYRGFIQSLLDTQQHKVVTEVLSEDIADYNITNNEHSTRNLYQHEAIINMKKTYIDGIFQTPLHSFSTKTQSVGLEKIYTPLDIVDNLLKSGKGVTRPTISEENMFKCDNQVSVLCVGDAGTGKTTLAKRIAWLWAKGNRSLSKFKVVILIQAPNEEENLEQTIRNALPGKKAFKDMIWKLYEDEPESILLIVEAYDQFQCKTVKGQIERMIRDGATNVFLTVRKDHHCINTTLQELFNTHLEVKGFSHERGVQFAKKYLKMMNVTVDIEPFLLAMTRKVEFQTNPLNLTLTCQLYSQDELDIKQFDALTEVQIYSIREARILEREYVRQEKSRHSYIDCQNELHKLHALALYMLVGNRSMCNDADLRTLGIKMDSKLLVLLEERTKSTAKYGQEHYWIWPQSRLQEFSAAMALSTLNNFKSSQWLVWVANRPDLNHLAQFLSAQFIQKDMYDEVITLTSATMILQKRSVCQAGKNDSACACSWIPEMTRSLTDTITTETCIDGDGNLCFYEGIKVPDIAVFKGCCGSVFDGNIKLFQHIQTCWRLGSFYNRCSKFVKETQLSLLPAIDRSSADDVHIMVSKPSHGEGLFNNDECNGSITHLNIHCGIATNEETMDWSEKWKLSIQEQLDRVKPTVLNIHHGTNTQELTLDIIQLANDRGYIIYPHEDTWILLLSHHKTTQGYVGSSSRFYYIQETDNRMDINIEQISDVQHIKPTPHLSKRLEIHVGFPAIFSEYKDTHEQRRTSQSEWKRAIDNVLFGWLPECLMVIDCYKANSLEGVLDKDIINQAREKGYDAIQEKRTEIRFRKIPPEMQTFESGTSIYTSQEGTTTVRFEHVDHVFQLKAADIKINIEDTLVLVLSDHEEFPPYHKLVKELERAILHLLVEFRFQHVRVKPNFSTIYSQPVLKALHSTCKFWASGKAFDVHFDGDDLLIGGKYGIKITVERDCDSQGFVFITTPNDDEYESEYENTDDEKMETLPDAVQRLPVEYQQAFRKACTNGVQKVCRCRVMLIGHFGAGKTSIKNTLLGDAFDSKPSNTNLMEVSKTRNWQHHSVKEEYEECLIDYTIQQGNTEMSRRLLDMKDVDRIIQSTKPQLLRNLVKDLDLLSKLQGAGVMRQPMSPVKTRKSHLPTLYSEISKLLDDIKTGPVERFLTFCRTLHTEGQGHLLLIMGVDIKDIEKQAATSAAVHSESNDNSFAQNGQNGTFSARQEQDSQAKNEYGVHMDNFVMGHTNIQGIPQEVIANESTKNTSNEQPTKVTMGEDVEEGNTQYEADAQSIPQHIPREMERTILERIISTGRGETNTKPELSFWDSGGQSVFYHTTVTFMSRRSIFIIAMDMTKSLEDPIITHRQKPDGSKIVDHGCPQSVQDHLEYWLTCIHTFLPAHENTQPEVIIVGTRKDEVTHQKQEEFPNAVWNFLRNKPYADHVHRVLTLSNINRDDKDVQALKEAILEIAKKYTVDLPLKWVNFKDKLLQCTESNLPRKKFDEAVELGRKLQLIHEGRLVREVRAALSLFHELGDILFFDEKELGNSIITDPKWLIRQFRQIITVPKFGKQKQFTGSTSFWDQLDEKGVINARVLQHVWTENVREYLITTMMKFGLLLPLSYNVSHCSKKDKEGRKIKKAKCEEKCYIVPCLLPSVECEPFEEDPTKRPPPVLLLPPNGFMPVGITCRLIIGLVNEDGWEIPSKIYHNHAVLLPRKCEPKINVTIHRESTFIMIKGKELKDAQSKGDFCHALNVIKARLDVITSTVCPMYKTFNIGVHCLECKAKGCEKILNLEEVGGYNQHIYCSHDDHQDMCDASRYLPWFSEEKDGTVVAGSSERGADECCAVDPQLVELVSSITTLIKQELKDAKPRLIGPTGLGSVANNSEFIAFLQSMEILDCYNIQKIEAEGTQTKKAGMLIDMLLPCSPAKVTQFVWILVKKDQGHQLTKISKDFKKLLKQCSETQIKQLPDAMDN